MNYSQTLEYLYAQLPMFHRVGAAAYKANLDNTIALAKHLGNPQDDFPSIHIAGTNGKGSVAHILASALQQAGYKTGLATSPHLKDFRERFRINGRQIPEEYITGFVLKHKNFLEKIQPSFFEMTIAMTFDFFSREKVDIAVVETGMGGRLDSTNIIHPELSIITNIGLDHMNLLGDTLPKIAREKAGIIKTGVPLVVGRRQIETMPVFDEKAKDIGAPIVYAEDSYKLENPKYTTVDGQPMIEARLRCHEDVIDIRSPLTGTYQYENICTAFAAIEQINKAGRFRLPLDAAVKGLAKVVENTGMAGRWQQLSKNPLTICDTGHNHDGMVRILENIRMTTFGHLHFVLGMMNDKDILGILKLLPVDNTTYYFCKPDVPRGLDVLKLKESALQLGMKGESYFSVEEALASARQKAHNRDLVFVGGSTFVVAEVV